MPGRGVLRKLLLGPQLSGRDALLCAAAALAAPTLLRVAIDGYVEDLAFTAYLPFVLLSAVLLDWRAASAVALGSALLADLLFVAPRGQVLESPSDLFGLTFFGLTALLAIAIVNVVRKATSHPLQVGRPIDTPKPIIFSLKDGQACVSWEDGPAFVPLGRGDEVAEVMREFLAQQAVGERLSRRSSSRAGGEMKPDALASGPDVLQDAVR